MCEDAPISNHCSEDELLRIQGSGAEGLRVSFAHSSSECFWEIWILGLDGKNSRPFLC